LSAVQELVAKVGRECNYLCALLPNAQDSQEDAGGAPQAPLTRLPYLRIIGADLKFTGEDNGCPGETAILNLIRRSKFIWLGLQRLAVGVCKSESPSWIGELRLFVSEVFWDGFDEACPDEEGDMVMW
jgi:hypothetical protein